MDTDYIKLRQDMVDNQLVRRGITDQRVINAMRTIPRHLFVDLGLRNQAYEDHPLKIDKNQTISQPYIVALMSQYLDLDQSKTVLEIGTGSGYQTAVLAEICKQVYTMEYHSELFASAKDNLAKLGYKNIIFAKGDGSRGWMDPNLKFNGIMITAAAPRRMEHLFHCLVNHGRLVVPEGSLKQQTLKLYIRNGADTAEENICSCVFVPLKGKYGWEVETNN